MGIVSDVMTYTDTTLVQYAQNVFTAVAAPLATLLKTAGVVSLLFVVLNNVFQFTTVSIASYMHWVLRFVLVMAFATIWANFQLLYDLMINVPEDYIALLLKAGLVNLNTTPNPDIYDPAQVTDVYSAIDEFGNGMFNVAGDIIDGVSAWDPASWKYLLVGVAVIIMAAIFIAAAVIIVLVAKVGFALAIGLAPLAIAFLLLPQTRSFFQSWLNFAIGFAVVPLLTAGIMSVVLMVALNTQPPPAPAAGGGFLDFLITLPIKVFTGFGGGGDLFAGYLAFILVSLAALVLMFQIPTMASSLAQTSVAAVGAGALFAAKRMAGGALSSAISTVAAPVSAAKNMAYVAKNASMGGQSKLGSIGTALSSMRVGSQVRQARLANNIPFNRPGGAGGAQKALPAPPKPAGSGASGGAANRPMSEEMRNQMKK